MAPQSKTSFTTRFQATTTLGIQVTSEDNVGFLDFNTGRYHYVFLESQKDPDNDPINWWFNGGPGCSSMFGMLYEHGPFVFKTNSLNIMINEWAWNKEANVLYIETPGGVMLCVMLGWFQ